MKQATQKKASEKVEITKFTYKNAKIMMYSPQPKPPLNSTYHAFESYKIRFHLMNFSNLLKRETRLEENLDFWENGFLIDLLIELP